MALCLWCDVQEGISCRYGTVGDVDLGRRWVGVALLCSSIRSVSLGQCLSKHLSTYTTDYRSASPTLANQISSTSADLPTR